MVHLIHNQVRDLNNISHSIFILSNDKIILEPTYTQRACKAEHFCVSLEFFTNNKYNKIWIPEQNDNLNWHHKIKLMVWVRSFIICSRTYMLISLEPYITKYFQQTPKQLSCMKEIPKAFGIALPVAYLYNPPPLRQTLAPGPPPLHSDERGPRKTIAAGGPRKNSYTTGWKSCR